MIGNDFVMMALFIVVPLLGLLAMALVVKHDEVDHKHKIEHSDRTQELEPFKKNSSRYSFY